MGTPRANRRGARRAFEQQTIQFLTLSAIQGETGAQQSDPFAPLDESVRRFHQLHRWRPADRVDLDPYGRLLSNYRDEARRKLAGEPEHAATFLQAATRLGELLLRLVDHQAGPATARAG